MKPFTQLQRQVLTKVIRITHAGDWYRAEDHGERVTLASLHTRGVLTRRIWKENQAAATRGAYSSPAHEYQATGLVMQVARELLKEAGL